MLRQHTGQLVYRVENLYGEGPYRSTNLAYPLTANEEPPIPPLDDPLGNRRWDSPHALEIEQFCYGEVQDWVTGVLTLSDLRKWFPEGVREIAQVNGWGVSVYEPVKFFECGTQVVFDVEGARPVTRIGTPLRSFATGRTVSSALHINAEPTPR